MTKQLVVTNFKLSVVAQNNLYMTILH